MYEGVGFGYSHGYHYGDLISGAGVTSGLDLALHLVERSFGPRIAHQVEQLTQYERRGVVWR